MTFEELMAKDYTGAGTEPKPVSEPAPVATPSVGSKVVANALLGYKMGGTLVDKVFNFFQRPQYGLAGGVLGAVKEGDPIGGAYKGFVQGEPASFIDVLNTVYPDERLRIPNALTGTALDFMTDPLLLVQPTHMAKLYDMVGLSSAFRATGTLARQLSKKIPVPFAGRSLSDWIPMFKTYGDFAPFPHMESVFHQHKLNEETITRYVLKEVEERANLFREAAAELGYKDPDRLLDKIWDWYQYRDRTKKSGMLGAKEMYIPWQLRKGQIGKDIHWLDEMWQKELQAGLVDPKEWVWNYLPGIMKDTKSGKYFDKTLRYKDPSSLFFTKAKKYQTAEEYQKALDGWEDMGHLPESKDYEVVHNWYEALGVRAWLSEMALEQTRFAEEVVRRSGIPVARIKGGLERQLKAGDPDPTQELNRTGWVAVVPSNNLRKDYGKTLHDKLIREALEDIGDFSLLEMMEQRGHGALIPILTGGPLGHRVKPVTLDLEMIKHMQGNAHIIPIEVYEAFKRMNNVWINPPYLGSIIKGIGKLGNMWKAMATSLNIPTFQSAQIIGNTAALVMAGMNPAEIMKYTGRAVRLQHGSGTHYGMNSEQFLEFVDQLGARGYGFVGSDVPSRFGAELQKALDFRSLPEKLSEWGAVRTLGIEPAKWASLKARAFSTLIEDNSRLAVMMWKMDQLGAGSMVGMPERLKQTAERGVKLTNEVLHDYSDISPVVRDLGKPLVPFVTFMSKNIARHFEALFMNPAYYSRLAKYSEDLWPLAFGNPGETEQERFLKAKWMREGGYRKTSFVDDRNNPVYAKANVPVDQLMLFERPAEFLRSLTPAVALLDIARNVGTWPSVHPLDTGRRVAAPFWINWLGDPKDGEKWNGLMNLGPMRSSETGEMIMGMSPQWKMGLEQAFPFLKTWSGMFPQESQFVTEEAGKWRALGMTGIKFVPLDMQKRAKIRRMETGNPRRSQKDTYWGERKGISRNLGRPLTEEEDQEIRKRVYR